MTRQINTAGLEIVKESEGCKLQAYQDQRGIWTIGCGHVPSHEGQEISQEVADALLLVDLERIEQAVMSAVGDVPTTDNQFSAFVSMAYNIGPNALAGSTAMHRHLAGDYPGCAAAMLWWDQVDGRFSEGLLRRRKREAGLYLTV